MNSKILLFDFEVFAHDTLLGVIELNKDGPKVIQTWNLDEIRQIYKDNINSIWIGHNCSGYDNFILQAIVKGCNEEQVKVVNDKIISGNRKMYLDIKLNYYELMYNHATGLKTIECAVGKNISTSEVDFNLTRKLTDIEKQKTESYNRDDLSQTFDDFNYIKDEFMLRVDVINEFKLPLEALHVTGTQLAEMVLHAEKVENIDTWVVKPEMYPQLHVNNPVVRNFYLNEDFRAGKHVKVNLCGCEHTLGAGGIHAAISQCHEDWAFYFDVSGYYNLVMINYDLLPRSIPAEYRAYYKSMYEHQLELKKTNPGKRWVYKIILLSVFGAMTNSGCKFYDPYRGTLVTMVGQMFLVDLLEKLEGKAKVIQSNTDGVIAKPLPGVSKEELVEIIDEWQHRTGFVLKLETIYDIHQRDVNCYMYKDDKGNIHVLGEALKYYEAWENPLWENVYMSREPVILQYALVEYFMNHRLPEDVIKEHERQLRLFQYVCKKGSTYNWVEYEVVDKATGDITSTNMQSVNRAFAMKDQTKIGMLYKFKQDKKLAKAKIPSNVDSVFIHNDEILSDKAVDELLPQIDFDFYINRAYERINEFIETPSMKGFLV